MTIDLSDSRHHMTSKKGPLPVNHLDRIKHHRHAPLAPLEKAGALKMVAIVAVACADVALAIGGIYLYGLYRQTVDRFTGKMEKKFPHP